MSPMTLTDSRARRAHARSRRTRRRVTVAALAAVVSYGLVVWALGGDPAYRADLAAAQASADPSSSPDPADALRAQLARERRAHRATVTRLREKVRTQTSIASAAKVASVVYGVPAGQILSVARCESELRPNAVGRAPAGNGEHARGLLQFLPSTWARTPMGRAGVSVYDPYASALAAAAIVRPEGWKQWVCRP